MAGVTKDTLKKAEEDHKKGLPLPEGVSYQPYRNPPYMSIEDAEKRDRDLAGGPGDIGAATPVENSGS